MGKAIQVGVFNGRIKEFNKFLAYRQQLGDTYIHSKPLESRVYYFALMTSVNLDQEVDVKDTEPKQLEGEVDV